MRLVVSPLAARKLAGIADYISAHDPAAASRVDAAIRDTFAMLARHPYAGPRIADGIRRFVVPGYPYVVLYRPDAALDRLVIATIRHSRQRPI